MYDIINRSPIHRVRHPFCVFFPISFGLKESKEIHDTCTDYWTETCVILPCKTD